MLSRFDAIEWAFIALVTAFSLGLFNHGLVPSMEPRFAEVVREMMATGEWLVPIKNGRPYVEYPVFYYWFAIAGKAIGLPMTAAIRLPTYAAFLGWVVLLKRWQVFLAPQMNANAYALVGASLPLVLFEFSIAQTDGPLVYGVLVSMYGYTKHISASGERSFPWLIWLGASIAALAKGPVGIACTLPIILCDQVIAGIASWKSSENAGVATLANSILRRAKSVGWARGTGIVLLVTVPWYVLAGTGRGWEFVEAILVYQNFDRYLTGYSHAHPWWYYLKTISYDFFPVSLLLPIGIWASLRRFAHSGVRLVMIWALFTLVFFSCSGSKQGKYILPAAPAFIALAFFAIEFLRDKFGTALWPWLKRWSVGFIAIWFVAIVLVIPFFSGQIGGRDGFEPIRAQIEAEPGQLIHFQWPRSLTLYELGAPMPFVRSARELYENIHNGSISSGDYVLVKQSDLGAASNVDPGTRLIPYPNDEVFDQILTTKIEKEVVLLRVKPQAETAALPDTPEPVALQWREQLFDTD